MTKVTGDHDDPHLRSTVVANAPWLWMKANGLPSKIPDDAELDVDETAGTITVEVWATDDEGRVLMAARRGMTRIEVFPLLVPPPAGLLSAYQHTMAKLRRERNAAEAIRYETAVAVCAEIRRAANADYDAGGVAARIVGRLSACDDVWAAIGRPAPPAGEPVTG